MGNLKLSGHTFVGGITPDSLRRAQEARKAELSRTWKERHAKGVPVKMTLEEWKECVRINYRASGFDVARPSLSVESSYPIVICSNFYDEDDESSAYFCNFRYKQTWIDKKGGNNG